jgi:xanthine/uracil/vitamin C permease (AzgA family)
MNKTVVTYVEKQINLFFNYFLLESENISCVSDNGKIVKLTGFSDLQVLNYFVSIVQKTILENMKVDTSKLFLQITDENSVVFNEFQDEVNEVNVKFTTSDHKLICTLYKFTITEIKEASKTEAIITKFASEYKLPEELLVKLIDD